MSTKPYRTAVFLDRDGVINRAVVRDGKPYPPSSLQDFEFLPGVEQAVANLRIAGFDIIVVTNQPDVATGKQELEVVEAIHRHVFEVLKVDDIKVCYHVDEDQCVCRKPQPGMLLESALSRSIALGKSYMIGDRWRDIGAGQAAGCKTIYINSDYEEQKPSEPDLIVASLLEASEHILAETA
jgi:D-glycero-D-manno-heptose 1,7-bisphosphate phosphatase